MQPSIEHETQELPDKTHYIEHTTHVNTHCVCRNNIKSRWRPK